MGSQVWGYDDKGGVDRWWCAGSIWVVGLLNGLRVWGLALIRGDEMVDCGVAVTMIGYNIDGLVDGGRRRWPGGMVIRRG